MEPVYIGQTRYSLFIPNSSAWRASSKSNGRSEEEYKHYLYSSERLSFRDRVFSELTVPALADAAEGHLVWHIVSYSESLPERFKDSLRTTAERFPFLLLQELPDGVADWGRAEGLIKEKVACGVFGRYRLDDDDVLSRHYFRSMDRFVKPEFVGMVASLPRGIEAIYDNDHFFNFREAHVPMNSMGMLYISELTDQGIIGPRAGAHDKADRLAPVIMDASEIGYLRTNHIGQDNMLRHKSAFVAGRLVSNMDKHPAMRSTEIIRENFPSIAPLLLNDDGADACDWEDKVENGVELDFNGVTPGLTVTISGEAPSELRRNPLALSFDLESPSGRWVNPRASLKGLPTSLNPLIGQFVYFDVTPGKFTATASIFLADGVKIRVARIVPLTHEARQIRISNLVVDHEAAAVRFGRLGLAPSKAAARTERARAKVRNLGQRVWPVIKPVANRVLGVGRTDAMLEFAAARLK